jgi:hypothetical protein
MQGSHIGHQQRLHASTATIYITVLRQYCYAGRAINFVQVKHPAIHISRYSCESAPDWRTCRSLKRCLQYAEHKISFFWSVNNFMAPSRCVHYSYSILNSKTKIDAFPASDVYIYMTRYTGDIYVLVLSSPGIVHTGIYVYAKRQDCFKDQLSVRESPS